MRWFFCLVLFGALVSQTMGQDSLFLHDGRVIPARLIKVTKTDVLYETLLDGRVVTINRNKNDVRSIRYANGYMEHCVPHTRMVSAKRYGIIDPKTNKPQKDTVKAKKNLVPVHLFLAGPAYGAFKYQDLYDAPGASISYAHSTNNYALSVALYQFNKDNQKQHFQSTAVAFLFGHAVRKPGFFMSISTGLALSDLYAYNLEERTLRSSSNGYVQYITGIAKVDEYKYSGGSFPVEWKIFFSSKRGFGAGLQLFSNWVGWTRKTVLLWEYPHTSITLSLGYRWGDKTN